MIKNKVFDFFSGAGGMSIGFKRAGFNVVLVNDINSSVIKTIKKNDLCSTVINDNIENISKEVISNKYRIDCKNISGIIGGPPCQGFSLANTKSRFLDNPNNQLIVHFIRLVKEVKPMFFVLENVVGLMRMNSGSIIYNIINTFKKLNYKVDCEVLNAVNYGVPQNRERIFIIGNRFDKSIIFPDLKFPNIEKSFISTGEALEDLYIEAPNLKSGEIIHKRPYNTEPVNSYQKLMRKNASFIFNHRTTKNSDLVIKRYQHIPQGGNWKNIPKKLMNNYKNISNCHSNIYRRLEWNKPSITISNFRRAMLVHPISNRGLSVREAARLQSFPDDIEFIGNLHDQQQMVANAVPPLLAESIAEELIKQFGE